MVLCKILDQYLSSYYIRTKSIQRFEYIVVLKTLMQNCNIKTKLVTLTLSSSRDVCVCVCVGGVTA